MKASFRLGMTLPLKISLLSKMNDRQVVELARPVGDDPGVTPESRPQQAEVRHRAEYAVHVVEEDDPLRAIVIEAGVQRRAA